MDLDFNEEDINKFKLKYPENSYIINYRDFAVCKDGTVVHRVVAPQNFWFQTDKK